MGINAGHDLDRFNLQYLIANISTIEEVSIGHALITDALYLGLENTIQCFFSQSKNQNSDRKQNQNEIKTVSK